MCKYGHRSFLNITFFKAASSWTLKTFMALGHFDHYFNLQNWSSTYICMEILHLWIYRNLTFHFKMDKNFSSWYILEIMNYETLASLLGRVDLRFCTFRDTAWENRPKVSFPRYCSRKSTWGIIINVIARENRPEVSHIQHYYLGESTQGIISKILLKRIDLGIIFSFTARENRPEVSHL